MSSISFLDEGISVKIKDILLKEKMGKKLQEMGINKGVIIDIIKNDGASLIIGVSGTRIAINRGIAQKILAE